MYDPDFTTKRTSPPPPPKQDQEKTDEDEDYESDEYYDEQGRKVQEIDYSKVDYAGPSVPPLPEQKPMQVIDFSKDEFQSGNASPLPVKLLPNSDYTMDDMNPTIRDLRCSSNTDLACFWPVYVGNFKGNEVEKYFASRGLHVRWWYRRIDEYYHDFQKLAGLYDMLVYFVSERDAKLAIEQCHRATYKGYTLNVFPGREPVYFKPDRSVYAERMKSGRVFSEHFFEKHVKHICNVTVRCVVKFDMQNGALEFGSPHDVIRAQIDRMWTYLPVKEKMQKQRFLEKDLINQMERFLAENPLTLKPKENDKYMKMLLQGKRPPVDNPNKHYKVIPLRRGPGKRSQLKRLQKKLKKKYGADGY